MFKSNAILFLDSTKKVQDVLQEFYGDGTSSPHLTEEVSFSGDFHSFHICHMH